MSTAGSMCQAMSSLYMCTYVVCYAGVSRSVTQYFDV